jgi:hypothetical protein
MNYAIEMGSGTMMCIRSFIKIGLGVQMLLGGGTQRGHGDHISIILFF